MNLLARSLRFYAVGGVGIAVQLVALGVLKRGFGMNYLLATALAVEIAILHNFLWHQLWTWRDRGSGWAEAGKRLVRFNLTSGGLSIAANVVLMRLLAGTLGIHYLLANLIAIGATAAANFLASEWFVFRPEKMAKRPSTQ
ncbi:MAG: GtrA family protein [Acidimicrobiia bacterium]|nr:GtrA family protein [Acidimicrobiia bacterium]